MASETDENERFSKRVLAFGVGYALLVLSVCTPLLGIVPALSAPLGAAIGLANLWVSSRGLAALVSSRALGPWGVFMLVKLSLSGLVLYGLFQSAWASPLPLVIGLGAVPVSLALAQLFTPRTLQASSRPAP
jgi:hypothetical protein